MLKIRFCRMTFTSDVREAPSVGPFNAVLWGLRCGLNAALNPGCFAAAVDMSSTVEKAMNRRLVVALIGGTALVAATGVLIATAQPRGAVFIANDQPVTEAQVREKLQSDGYSNIQVVRQGHFFEALGSKDGKTGKILVDARTGRLADDDDD
jgi:hypothetical protein